MAARDGLTRESTVAAARTIAALALLHCALPANVALTGVALIRNALTHPTPASTSKGLTILLSGGKMTKALHLARSFHAAGHRVILVESRRYWMTGHRFSRAVDRFYTVPECDDPGYAEALRQIVVREGVDVYVPVCSPASSYYDALAAAMLAPHCEVLHASADLIETLDDKERFAALATSIGLSMPQSYRITAAQQVADIERTASGHPFILKSIAYDPVHRLDLTPLPKPSREETMAFAERKPIAEDNPWVLQEFIDGQEFCTHSTFREGRVVTYVCCPSSSFLVNYTAVDKPKIQAWVTEFAAALGVSGQISLDFIEDEHGEIYAIECNPRTHSAITLFTDPAALAQSYLDGDISMLTPAVTSRPTYWLYHEIWRLLARPVTARERLSTIIQGRDAVFDWSDPLPFLLLHHLQIPWLLLENLRQGTGWVRIDFNIGKLVAPGGD